MKPLIGITTWRRTLDTFYGPDHLHTLSSPYVDSVVAAGMDPILFPSSLDPGHAGRLVDLVDGVLLTGGDDIDPATYGEVNTDSKKVNAAADRFEIAVVTACREQGKPVLAICRGLQLLNVAMGGTLNQEVTSEGGVHDLVTADHEEMDARRHVVGFEPGSVLGEIYGTSETKVNSLHHQGVGRLGDGLVVEGRTDDGLIECFRADGDWWALAVQWHPEQLDDEHQRVFTAFRRAIEPATV